MPRTPPTLRAPFDGLTATTGYLEVPGTSLYYETYGDGPITLLFISGGNGNLEVWRLLAGVLATKYNYRVAIYDRRGFSRSWLSPTARQDYSKRLETDATDAKLLLEELSAKGQRPEKRIVLGTSSGAIVAVKFLELFSDAADKIFVHEPPLLTLLPDSERLIKQQHEVYDMYRAFGAPAALLLFAQYNGLLPGPSSTDATYSPPPFVVPDMLENPHLPNNTQYWFEREFLHYPLVKLDMEAIAKKNRGRMVLANGGETDQTAAMFRTGVLIHERYGVPLVKLAGDHMGYQIKSTEWAADFDAALHAELGN